MDVFGLSENRFVPEVDELNITLYRLKQVIEWTNEYNYLCRMGAARDQNDDPIPVQYIGKNRYWMNTGEGQDDKVGPYSLISVYDLDPTAPEGRRLLVRYRLTDARGKLVQTMAQAEKHIIACRLEAERKERMAKKNPRLNTTIDIHLPQIYSPAKAASKVEKI